jgi:hypothetical protein
MTRQEIFIAAHARAREMTVNWTYAERFAYALYNVHREEKSRRSLERTAAYLAARPRSPEIDQLRNEIASEECRERLNWNAQQRVLEMKRRLAELEAAA